MLNWWQVLQSIRQPEQIRQQQKEYFLLEIFRKSSLNRNPTTTIVILFLIALLLSEIRAASRLVSLKFSLCTFNVSTDADNGDGIDNPWEFSLRMRKIYDAPGFNPFTCTRVLKERKVKSIQPLNIECFSLFAKKNFTFNRECSLIKKGKRNSFPRLLFNWTAYGKMPAKIWA